MSYNLNGLLADYHFISQEDQDKRDAERRAQVADEATKPSDDGFDLGGMLGNILGGGKNVLRDIAQHAYDTSPIGIVGHGISDIASGTNPLSEYVSRQRSNFGDIGGGFSGEKQLGKFGVDTSNLPDEPYMPIRQAVDVLPAVGAGLLTGGAAEAPTAVGLGGAFLKSLALNTGINVGLGQANEAAQDVPGWRALPADAQNAAVMAGTVLGGHALGKALPAATRALGTPSEQAAADYRPRILGPEEPLDPRAAELAGIQPNERPTDPKLAAIHDAVYNPDALGPGLSEYPPQTLDNMNSQPNIGSADLGDLARTNSQPRFAGLSDQQVYTQIEGLTKGVDSGQPISGMKPMETDTRLRDLYTEAASRGIDVGRSIQQGQIVKIPNIAGGASKWSTLFREGPISTINSTLRAGHVLFDLASWGRLGPQVGLLHPAEFVAAMKASAQSIVQGRAPVIEAWNKIDAEAAASGGLLPDTSTWRTNGLSMHTPSTGLLAHVPIVRNVSGMYQNFLDVLRPLVATEELRNRLMSGKIDPGQATDSTTLGNIAKGTNLLTGKSSANLSSETDLLAEFPNWIAAQGEMIVKAFTSGQIDGQMARSSLLRLVGMGTLVTYGVNAAQEGSPNPAKALTAHIRNGIPQMNIPGTNMQVDMYGPLGELISKTLGVGVKSAQGYQQNGLAGAATGAVGAAGDMARSFASPIAKIATNQLTKSTAFGERVSTPEERTMDVINNALPFSTAEVAHGADQVPGVSVPQVLKGTRSAPADVLGSLGLRVHEPNSIDRALDSAGISKTDPDYLIKRKEYLQTHPQLRTTNDVTDLQNEIQASRQQLSDQLTASGSTLNLVRFRDERTKILQKQRDVLGTLLGDQSSASLGDTPQAQWLKSYNDLFVQAKDPKSPSGGIDQQKLDASIAQWTNDNGPQALDFVNRFTGTGLSPAESAYIGDLRTLDAAGYFTTLHDARYAHLQSGLTPDQIDAYKNEAESHRLALQHKASIAEILHQLHPNLTSKELGDIVHAGSNATANPAYQKFKAEHAKELLWFNSKVTWDTYQATSDNPNASPKRR